MTAPTSPTKHSTPRLSEVARHVVVPAGIVTTGWPSVAAKGRELGIGFDPWQDALGRIVLGKRKDGKYAATVGGVKLSIPRQVGKTYFVGALVMILCVLFPGLKVVWTAHRTRTATNTFRSLQGMARRKKFAPLIKHIRTANGEQEIAFANGSVIMFGAREQGFGRGFDEVDVEVFDEDQILTEKALEDMIAATNQSRHPHGALLFFMGTPPRPVDPGEAASARRSKALSGKSQDMVYVEFSADRDCDPDDRHQWAKANPSFPQRTPLESMLRLRENLPTDDAWMREALGVWGEAETRRVISAETWKAAGDEHSSPVDRLTLAVDVDPEQTRATVSLAGEREDGRWHVEIVDTRGGTDWVVEKVAKVTERNVIRAVVIDRNGPAARLIEPLETRGVTVTRSGFTEIKVACATFYADTVEDRLRHIDQPQLNASLAGARKRMVGDAWAWHRQNMTVDITPVVSCTLALWGAQSESVAQVKKPSAVFAF